MRRFLPMIAALLTACATDRSGEAHRLHRIHVSSLLDEITSINEDISVLRPEVSHLAKFLMDAPVSNRHATWRRGIYPLEDQIRTLEAVRDALQRERWILRKEKEFLEDELH
jgi:hypothetical protein